MHEFSFDKARQRLKNLNRDNAPVVEAPPELPILKNRFNIYSFTVPPTRNTVIALGFESHDEANLFIERRLKKDWNSNPIQRKYEENGVEYMVFYEVYEDQLDIKNTFSNPAIITTCGNYYADVLKRWNE